MSTTKVPVAMVLLFVLNATEKEVLPCRFAARVSIGSTVNEQPLPEELRVTEVNLVVSTPEASAQVMV